MGPCIYNSRQYKQISYNGKHISVCLGKCIRRAKVDALQRDIKKQLGVINIMFTVLMVSWLHTYIKI